MKVLGDKVLVRKDDPEEVTASGIIIPDVAQDKVAATGTIISIGTEKIPEELKIGTRVIFDKYAGESVKIDGKEHIVMKEFNIMGVIEDAN